MLETPTFGLTEVGNRFRELWNYNSLSNSIYRIPL